MGHVVNFAVFLSQTIYFRNRWKFSLTAGAKKHFFSMITENILLKSLKYSEVTESGAGDLWKKTCWLKMKL